MQEWYEYVLITGTFIRKGCTPDYHHIYVESGRVLIDMNVVGDNDEPVIEDTWLFHEFVFVAPGIFMPGAGGGLLNYEFERNVTDVFAPSYDEIVALFEQWQGYIQREPGYCSAAVLTQWLCQASPDYCFYTASMKYDNSWELVGEIKFSQKESER